MLRFLKKNEPRSEAEMGVAAARRERALAYIRANLADPNIRPASVAKSCGISRSYLHKLFQTANLTVSEYIFDQRLDRANLCSPMSIKFTFPSP